jgi:2-keto-4-pentenoate hydratase/2-oxohepta-3-ene-1,7-dioic acid hydratase in catechol pathway
MRICRFLSDQGPQWGAVEDVDGEPWLTRIVTSPPEERVIGHTGEFLASPISKVKLLAPVVPSKIICVGRNYSDHAQELGNDVPKEPLLFFKPPSALLAPGEAILRPTASQRVDFEGELGVIIGRQARDIGDADDVAPYIRGYVCVNDVTARDLQKTDGQWTRAKGFDTFCPVGPVIETEETELDLAAGLTIETRVNGELRQHGSTADFIFPLPELLVYITAAMTLEPGDLLLTGTPAGVGPLAHGDVVEISIPGLGTLSNPVQAEPA